MTAMMNDPATPLGKRLGVYAFFLAHMAGFGGLTFYASYHQQQDATFGIIALLVYVPFYLMMFGPGEVLWLAITIVLGLFMADGWLETLARPFIPEPGSGQGLVIHDFKKFPFSTHILPGMFLVNYEFMLRNVLIDVLGARHDERRGRYVNWLFVAVSAAQILAGYRW